MRSRLTCILAAVLFAVGGAAAQVEAARLGVGSEAPPLDGLDTEGARLCWERFDGQVVVLCFHKAEGFATKGLIEMASACRRHEELRGRVALLVVTDGAAGAEAARAALAGAAFEHAITVAVERAGYRDYRAVAFPTVFTIDGHRRIAGVVRGYGPLLATKVCATARLAAGLIDREGYLQALRSEPARRGDPEVRLAGLITALLQRRAYAAAAAQLDRLEAIAGRTRRSRLLRSELMLAKGMIAAAWTALADLPAIDVEATLLRGRILGRLAARCVVARLGHRARERVDR